MFLEPTQDGGRLFLQRGIAGPVVMLNLLRFREMADYSGYPALAPASPITGRQAYGRYADYLAGLGHRVAALEDSRLLPIIESDGI